MYNPQKIFDLIEKRGILKKDVILAIKGEGKWQKDGNLKQLVDRDVRVSTLEKIADYLRVSMDYFFDRDVDVSGVMVNGEGHRIKDITVIQKSETDALKELIAEKDKRIKLLEDMVELLKQNSK